MPLPRRTLRALARLRRRRGQLLFSGAVSALSVGLPRLVEACAVCFGDPDSPQTAGANYAILFLLAVTGGVLGSFGAFFIYLRRRARWMAAIGPNADSRPSLAAAAEIPVAEEAPQA